MNWIQQEGQRVQILSHLLPKDTVFCAVPRLSVQHIAPGSFSSRLHMSTCSPRLGHVGPPPKLHTLGKGTSCIGNRG